MTKQILSAIKVSTLAIALSFGMSYVYAWTAPVVTPPGGNVVSPLNTSATPQTKAGALTISGLTLPSGSVITGNGSDGTYGAITVQGDKGAYPGISFKDAAGVDVGTLAVGPTSSGFYNEASNNWRMYATGGTTSTYGDIVAGDYYAASASKWLSNMQPRVGGTCSIGYAITAINADGTVSCSQTGLGAGQAWQDKTSSRTKDTVYQNTTGRPMLVNVIADLIDTEAAKFYVGTANPPTLAVSEVKNDNPDFPIEATVSAVVPNNAYYKVSIDGALSSWLELR